MSNKYPRTAHLPWSPGTTRDDRVLQNVDVLLGNYVTITEKMDGSNVCLSRDNLFARSHNGSPTHSSFDLLKAEYAAIKSSIPEDIEIFGEWCYAKHSIQYDSLPAYLLVFGVRLSTETGTLEWAKWETTECIVSSLGLHTVPVIERCSLFMTEENMQSSSCRWMKDLSECGGQKEGFVVRPYSSFTDKEFSTRVGKYVRPNHVQSEKHWSSSAITRNKIRVI